MTLNTVHSVSMESQYYEDPKWRIYISTLKTNNEPERNIILSEATFISRKGKEKGEGAEHSK